MMGERFDRPAPLPLMRGLVLMHMLVLTVLMRMRMLMLKHPCHSPLMYHIYRYRARSALRPSVSMRRALYAPGI